MTAVISIGTNSTRLLLVEFGRHRARVVARSSIGTRVGEGLNERGQLGELPMRRTLDAVREHVRAIAGRSGTVAVIATSALRRANNAAELADRVREITGTGLRILTGDEEARYSFAGARAAVGTNGRLGVIDTGGGSTEYAVGAGGRVERAVSCEVGAVRLTE
ncbi:MAG: hypothetical protein ACREP1_09650, partial [Rhodanobacteraceae bacterium]